MKPLNEILTEIREKHGMNKKELANRMSKSKSTFARLEKGETRLQIEDIEKLSEIFNLSVIDVLTWPEKWVPAKDLKGYELKSSFDTVQDYQTRCKGCEEKERTIKHLEKLVSLLEGNRRKTGSD